ncbi:piggyBac transposable element-derived protein 4-like [Sitophilus oryzae]|uniref:PiggyBac transposable element-derived protein 4-like n=1 Tax=Sitophilus oryzae TaxID=7048 RepID=A0A6J2Y4V8_SITOR|nr:piggyBac transposable element-derived protein 4-like [Sitophilus oryzae]
MYIPSKPDKYGMKVIMVCDAKTTYMCSAVPYIGKEQRDPQNGSIPTQYVLKLTENIQGTNRNITMDNWFTSCELTEKLLEKGLTMVGTLRKNKREIPPQCLETKHSQIPSSAFAFTLKKLTLVSHVPKRNKCVILIRSMHSHDNVDQATSKPE